MNTLTHTHPSQLLWLGWVWDAVLEGHLNDKWGRLYPSLSILPQITPPDRA